MIPSSWFRRVIVALFILEMAGAMMWLSTRLVPNPPNKGLAQTIAAAVFLLGFYASAPLSARFLAPAPSRNAGLQERLARVITLMPPLRPVFLYDHDDKNAITVGIIPKHSRVYVTSGLMDRVSDEGLRGILAHEDAHIREHHILVTFIYACTYALSAHLTDSSYTFVLGFLAFMTLRRYLEYRADAGAAASVGRDAMVTGLQELHDIYPSKRLARLLTFLTGYPTLPMRIRALETGRRPLF